MRLDLALSERQNVSRRLAKKLIESHRVTVNGHVISVASRAVRQGDRISVVDDDATIEILRETDEFLAVAKPPGIPTQPAREQSSPSLLEVASSVLKRAGGSGDLFVIHRLDTGTSGVIVFAKNRAAAAIAPSEKHYLAIVEGTLKEPRTIDLPIARISASKLGVDPGGKPSRTIVTPREIGDRATLVEVELETGRTHQIRIHLAAIGHPVVGDRKYGSGGFDRPLLHAWRLEHPKLGVVEAPPPVDFQRAALDLIRSPHG